MISQFFKTDVHKFLCAVTLQLFFKELQNALFKGTVLQDFRPIGFFKYPRGVYLPRLSDPRESLAQFTAFLQVTVYPSASIESKNKIRKKVTSWGAKFIE